MSDNVPNAEGDSSLLLVGCTAGIRGMDKVDRSNFLYVLKSVVRVDAEGIEKAGGKEGHLAVEGNGPVLEGSGDSKKCTDEIREFLFSSDLPDFDFPKNMDVIATENFFYFHKYVMNPDVDENARVFSARDLLESSEHVCGTPLSQMRNVLHPEAALEKESTACYGLTFLSLFLSEVLNMDDVRNILTANEIQGNELSWSLGFVISSLPSALKDASVISDRHVVHQHQQTSTPRPSGWVWLQPVHADNNHDEL
eukprot:GHVO01069153.1.p1 GENE.GHVO01069153.1~~GHVO01069153.1.p1  ORF type:complete len:253 (+),score=55.22 GHVO01069153.1:113-871(+)